MMLACWLMHGFTAVAETAILKPGSRMGRRLSIDPNRAVFNFHGKSFELRAGNLNADSVVEIKLPEMNGTGDDAALHVAGAEITAAMDADAAAGMYLVTVFDEKQALTVDIYF
jgi:hypothetical protein